jgi:amino acid transporter
MGQYSIANLNTFFGIPGWLLLLLFFAMMLAFCEAGYRLGQRSRLGEKTREAIPTVLTAILGVLGLLLAFTMAMAVNRYDARRLLVLDEANAIGTDYWRTQLLPAPESTELQDLLRQYIDVRLRYAEAGFNSEKLQQVRRDTARLQSQLWSRAAAFAEKDPRSVTAGLLLQSLNTTFDLESARWTALLAHVPESVIYVNAFMGLLAGLLVGYGFGLTGNRHTLSIALLALSISVVLVVIIDLDRPRHGLLRISQQPLVDLQRQLAAPKH